MNRRSFFRKFGGLIAAVALAPEIAFRAKLQVPKLLPFWKQTVLAEHIFTQEYMDALSKSAGIGKCTLEDLMRDCYALKKKREQEGTADTIEFVIPL